MSTGIEVIVLTPIILNALAQLGIGLAAAAAGTEATRQLAGAAQAAADTLAAMRAEHQAALAEMAQTQSEEQAAAKWRRSRESEAAGSARALAAMTLRRATGGTRQMLAAGLQRLDERIAGLDPRPPDLDHAVADLRKRLEDEECDFAAVLDQYQQLAALAAQLALAQAQLSAAGKKEAPVLALLAEMAVLLDSPLFMTPAGQAGYPELREKYAEVERLAQSQPKLAESMAAGLRMRLMAVLDELAAHIAEQGRRAVALREDTNKLCGYLQALEHAAVPNARRAEAGVLRARLARLLADAGETALATGIRELLAAAAALYAATEQELSAKVAQAVVGGQVCDVLHGMGYAVDVLDEPGEAQHFLSPEARSAAGGQLEAQHFHVPLNSEAGIDVQLLAGGLLKSEMVAYAPMTAEAALENEKLACQVMDAMLKQLRERELEVQERFRTHYAEGETPPVVTRKRKASARNVKSEPLARQLPGDE